MEQTVFVAHGHWYVSVDGKQAVEYEVYKVVPFGHSRVLTYAFIKGMRTNQLLSPYATRR